MRKNLLSVMLALVLMLGLLCPAVSAAEITASGRGWNVEWVLDRDGTLTISGSGPMTDSEYTFEPPWGGYTDAIRAVVIADGVRSIERYAFISCPNLSSVTIGGSVTAIGAGAFADCGSLRAIHIPDSVEEIGASAFSGCGALTSITVAEGNPCCASLDGALTDSTGTRLIQIPGGISGTYIVPDSVTWIENGAFLNCQALTGVVFPDHITELPEGVLRDLRSLTSVELPSCLTRIPRDAFSGCTALRSVALPGTLECIADGAFEGCAGLGTLVLPGSVTAVGDFVFDGCTALTVCYPEDSAFWTAERRAAVGPDVAWEPVAPGSGSFDSDLQALSRGVAFLYRTCR